MFKLKLSVYILQLGAQNFYYYYSVIEFALLIKKKRGAHLLK